VISFVQYLENDLGPQIMFHSLMSFGLTYILIANRMTETTPKLIVLVNSSALLGETTPRALISLPEMEEPLTPTTKNVLMSMLKSILERRTRGLSDAIIRAKGQDLLIMREGDAREK
jgi:hypothetical protein